MALDLLHNQLLQGAGLMSGGAMIWQYVRSLPTQIWANVKGHKRIEVKITKEDSVLYFNTIMDHICKVKGDMVKKTITDSGWDGDNYRTIFRPNDNTYKLSLNGKILYATLDREDVKKGEGGSAPAAESTKSKLVSGITFHSYFLTKKEIHDFLLEFTKQIDATKETGIRIYKKSSGSYPDWYVSGYTMPRPLSSLVFEDPKIGNELKSDIEEFLHEREWYEEMNIPHRRGYLLYGSPGNGKSSLIRSLASELKMHLAPVNLVGMNDEQISLTLSSVPKNTIIVFEDVDAMFMTNALKSRMAPNPRNEKTIVPNDDDLSEEQQKDIDAMMGFGLSFSGLLNALDGIQTCENRIIIMTTNHREKLDAALIRPGRCDKHVHIGPPSKRTIARMYTRFFPNDLPEQRRAFVNQFENYTISMAEIQEKLLVLKETRRRDSNFPHSLHHISIKNNIILPEVTSKSPEKMEAVA